MKQSQQTIVTSQDGGGPNGRVYDNYNINWINDKLT